MDARKIIRFLVLLYIIVTPAWFIFEQFVMSSKVAHIKDQFNSIVEEKESGKISSYNGKIDSLVNERNKIINQEKYVFLGKWSTYWISYGIYFDATWFSEKLFEFLKYMTSNKPKNIFDYPVLMFILFVKPMIYLFFCIIFYWLRKPAV